jgi:hypothetical protein
MKNFKTYPTLSLYRNLSAAEPVELTLSLSLSLSLYKTNGFVKLFGICFVAEVHFIGVFNRLKLN